MKTRRQHELEAPAPRGPRHWPRAALDWLCAGRADYRALQRRRTLPGHRRRIGRCKTLWIGAGLLMLLQPTIPVILLLGLPATFLCFALLDESGR